MCCQSTRMRREGWLALNVVIIMMMMIIIISGGSSSRSGVYKHI